MSPQPESEAIESPGAPAADSPAGLPEDWGDWVEETPGEEAAGDEGDGPAGESTEEDEEQSTEEEAEAGPFEETADAITPADNSPIGPGPHTVAQGECCASIAYRAGFFEKTLWNHPGNTALRRLRKDSTCLLPGDVIEVPEKRLGQEPGATDKRHTFVRKGVPARLELRLLLHGLPRANVDCVLELDGRLLRNPTDGEGWFRCPIPPDARRGLLIVNPGPYQDEYEIVLGAMDPKNEISGLQGRLVNLGYDCPVSGTLDEATRAALAEFQEEHGLEVTGQPDEPTCDRLEEAQSR